MSSTTRCGALILVVGPSGVGKDTLMAGARERLNSTGMFVFANRYITRPANYGNEQHVPVSRVRFKQMLDDDEFALHWTAHGFSYGISRRNTDAARRQGCAVVVNGSRAVVEIARERFTPFYAVRVTASREAIANRLKTRGRETAEQAQARLNRITPTENGNDIVFHNDTLLEQAVDQFTEILVSLTN